MSIGVSLARILAASVKNLRFVLPLLPFTFEKGSITPRAIAYFAGIRRAFGLNQDDLALHAGSTRKTIGRLENVSAPPTCISSIHPMRRNFPILAAALVRRRGIRRTATVFRYWHWRWH